MSAFEIAPPKSRDEIVAGLDGLRREITELMRELGGEELVAPQGDAWSPERHLRHLTKSVRAVTAGMRVPRLILRLRFGGGGASRSFDEVVRSYRAALAAGADAGRFTPSERVTREGTEEEWRQQLLARWESAGTELTKTIGSWSEAALDRYRLPHPLLGKMTVREILYFTLYHNAHHARRIDERRA